MIQILAHKARYLIGKMDFSSPIVSLVPGLRHHTATLARLLANKSTSLGDSGHLETYRNTGVRASHTSLVFLLTVLHENMILLLILLHLQWASASVIAKPGTITGTGGATNASNPLVGWSPSCVSTFQRPDWAGDLDYHECAYSIGQQLLRIISRKY